MSAKLDGNPRTPATRARQPTSRALPRIIEVKAVGKESVRKDGFLWLEVRQVEEARQNQNFWLYVVENVKQGDPEQFRVLMFGGEQLQRLMARAKEKRYYELPLPVAEYDAARAGS